MKTLATVFGAMFFATSAMAADIYGDFDAGPDLSVWHSAEHDAPAGVTGVQPGIGDAPYAHDSAMFKSAPSAMPGRTGSLDRVDIYSGFETPDLQRGL